MKKYLITIVALAASVMLTACAGGLNGFGEPESMVVVHKNPHAGAWKEGQYSTAMTYVRSCYGDVVRQQAHPAETIATAGLGYGVTALAAAPLALKGIPFKTTGYPQELGIISGASGLVSGAFQASSARTSLVGTCANEDLRDGLAPISMIGVHVYGSLVRTNNTRKTPKWAMPASTTPPPPPPRQ